MSLSNPYDEAGGDWLLPKDRQTPFIPPLAPSAPKPSASLPSAPGGSLDILKGSPLGGADVSGALSGAAGLLSAIPSISTSATSGSGDASAGMDSSFNYNAAFQVGGSGRQSQDAGLDANGGGGSALLYVVIAAILGVVVLGKK